MATLRPDLLVNALGRQGYWLYRHLGDRFEPGVRTERDRFALGAAVRLGMGLVDFDNDGWRDLLVGQGHVMDDIERSDEALAHEEPMLLARNLFGPILRHFLEGWPGLRTTPGRPRGLPSAIWMEMAG